MPSPQAGRAPGRSARKLPLLHVAAILGFLGAACVDRGERAGAGLDAEQPVTGGTVVVAGPNDLDNANALVTSEKYTKDILTHVLFTTLVAYDSTMSYAPYLAESFEMLGDTGVVFRLRRDVFWHDGARTTAHDVAFTFERAKDPATAFAEPGYFEKWRDAVVQDSFTIRFRFEPHADPLASWAGTAIMPRHLLASVPAAQMRVAPFNKAPVGNGPFRFVEYRPGDRWVFAANERFPEALGGRPNLDRLVYRIILERTAHVNEVEIGGVDVALNPGADNLMRLDSLPDVRAIIRPSTQYASIIWNGLREPFSDARFRRAMTLAINRQEIVDVLRRGHGTPAIGPLMPEHWAFDATLEQVPFDTTAARALLDEIGLVDRDRDGFRDLPNGRPFRFGLKIPANNELNRDLATMVQAYLARVGIRMNLVPTEFATLIGDLTSPQRRFDAAVMALNSDFRVNVRDVYHSGSLGGPMQGASYSNPEVDRIIDQLDATVDRQAARPLWQRLQRILRDDQPWTYLYYYADLIAVRERVRGVRMDVRGAFTNVSDWWVADRADASAQSAGSDTAAR